MSVDLSPDGKTIVFDLLGDLYILPAKGGIATQITQGMAVNAYPVWSAKGDRIACLSDVSGENRLTVMDVSGNNPQSFNEPVWRAPIWVGADGWLTTPNIFYMAYPLYHLSGGEVQLPNDIYHIVGSSASGRFIYYKQTEESQEWSIYQYDTATGVKKILIDVTTKGAENVKVSKDGHLLSYLLKDGSSCSLKLVDILTKKEKVLANWQQNIPADLLPNYNFSADTKKIAIGYGGKIHLIEVQTGKDEIVPFTADVKVDLGKLNDAQFKVSQGPLEVKYMRSACASPDGKHLVFAALNRVYMMDLPNGKPKILINQSFGQFHPNWSPDSKWVTYVSWSDKDFGQVWKVKVDGSGLEQVTGEAGFYHYPSWSPDGHSITVNKATSTIDGKKPMLVTRDCGYVIGKLLSVNLEDRKVKTIADSISVINGVVYAADGESIIYKPDIRSNPGKCLISINKKMEKKTLAVSSDGFESTFRQIVLSPDGKYIVYTSEENLHLVPVAPIGTPTTLDKKPQNLPLVRFARGGFDPHWAQGGKVLNWSFANQYFEIDLDKIIAASIKAAEERGKKGLPQPQILDVDIVPDKTINIDLKVPQKTGKGLLALNNVRIISMKGTEVIENGIVLIKDGRFLSVGKNTEIRTPKGTKVIDLAGKTIMPGLIDLHNHIMPNTEIFSEQKWNLEAALAYGATTARDPSASYDTFGYEEILATGQMAGPRLFSVGRPVGRAVQINSLEEARIMVQKSGRMGAVVVKQYKQPTRLKRQLVLLACEGAGLNMTNEVIQDMPGFISHLKDGTSGIEHNPLWGEVYNDVIQLVARSGVYLTPTLQAPFPLYEIETGRDLFIDRFSKIDSKLARFYPEATLAGKNLEKLTKKTHKVSILNHSKVNATIRHAGGRITMGSHGEDPGLGAHFETWALQMGGLSNLEALQAATIMAAGALGMQQDLGSIEPGKIADLIILNKNPLDNIRNTIEIQSVIKDGVLYNGDTLDEIWPVAKKFKFTKSY